MQRIAFILAILLFSGCASSKFDRITVKASPRASDNRFDFSIEFHSEKGIIHESN